MRQPERWPKDTLLSLSKTTRKKMETALLDPGNGFTQSVPRQSPSQPPGSEKVQNVRESPPQASEQQGTDKGVHSSTASAGITTNSGIKYHSAPTFIEDYRFTPARKIVVDMDLEVLDGVVGVAETSEASICVRTRDIVRHLSISPILNINHQHVAVSRPYPDNPEFFEFLYVGPLEKHNSGDIDTLKPTVSLLKNANIILRLYYVRLSFSTCRMSSIVLTQLDPKVGPTTVQTEGQSEVVPLTGSSTPLEIAQDRPASTSTSQGVISFTRIDQIQAKHNMVSWLRTKAESRKGYESFKKSHCRVLSNVEVVRTWAFAAQFYHEFHGTRYYDDDEIPSAKDAKGKKRAGTKVTKVAIEDALDVGGTWFQDALTAYRLVQTFGRGGAYEDPAIVEAVESDSTAGRVALYEFLCQMDG
ncbi:hypothetical protein BDN72DRAFT_898989 [Pluteus cervinus]|uniref:Uncharacterized protein n=1 Tax=Pluteus cervinus TaxID=181527 RepID=A0ACD3AP09_9AGAR|nr:hypothetical protein BDN72DRAFT_898989 [Pluteus cervinus]